MTHSGQMGFYVDHDGVRLLGTLFLARGDSAKPTALLLHGIPGIEKNYDLAHALRDAGWNAVIFHYRGSWGSSGNYTLRKIPDDVRAVVDHLATGLYEQVDPERLIVIGHSLGGWAAVLSAAIDQRLKAAAVIAGLSAPSEYPLADPVIAAEYTPWLTGISPEGLAAQWAALDDEMTPLKQVHRILPRPLLVLHSLDDDDVSISHSRRLQEAVGGKAILIEFQEANHLFTWHRHLLTRAIFNWLPIVEKSFPGAPSGIQIRSLSEAGFAGARTLLTESGLPLAGFPDHTQVILGAFIGERFAGCAALEIHGEYALLRSVAVREEFKRSGIGAELTRTCLAHALARNLRAVFLLTETAQNYFPRFGFRPVSRSDAPEEIRRSVEFTGACPDSAIAMSLNLGA